MRPTDPTHVLPHRRGIHTWDAGVVLLGSLFLVVTALHGAPLILLVRLFRTAAVALFTGTFLALLFGLLDNDRVLYWIMACGAVLLVGALSRILL